jgi:hypothetical protein
MGSESGLQTFGKFGLVNLRNLNSLTLKKGDLVKAEHENVTSVVCYNCSICFSMALEGRKSKFRGERLLEIMYKISV